MKKTKSFILSMLLALPLLLSAQQTVHIGDILCTDGSTVTPNDFNSSGKTAMGVVFFVDDSGEHGWAVHLDVQSYDINWVSPTYYDYGYDILNVPNCEYSIDAMNDLDGYGNTFEIQQAHGSDWYPAAWAVDFDNGWYLPAAGQLRWLMAYSYEVNETLQQIGATEFAYGTPSWFWSSTERGTHHAYVVSRNGSTANYMKYNYQNTSTIGVRAIRDF